MYVSFKAMRCVRIKTRLGIKTFAPGDTFTPKSMEAVKALLMSGTIEPASPCYLCREFFWWLSIHGVLICGNCHPPAVPELIKRWFSDEAGQRR